ncbi:hypothetical protein BS47DRAFT_1368647 [Hydnum rufescens UP504]|uniref:Uncharacterized protein n=1 Tax=Hydnum rufescens UP504 TaxID=1448309 RepID=A0A9P6DNH7_9AGAM|nr:hypothetical protein BS47DRAFT_1368647 [Hydnum rufescens UP504]
MSNHLHLLFDGMQAGVPGTHAELFSFGPSVDLQDYPLRDMSPEVHSQAAKTPGLLSSYPSTPGITDYPLPSNSNATDTLGHFSRTMYPSGLDLSQADHTSDPVSPIWHPHNFLFAPGSPSATLTGFHSNSASSPLSTHKKIPSDVSSPTPYSITAEPQGDALYNLIDHNVAPKMWPDDTLSPHHYHIKKNLERSYKSSSAHTKCKQAEKVKEATKRKVDGAKCATLAVMKHLAELKEMPGSSSSGKKGMKKVKSEATEDDLANNALREKT